MINLNYKISTSTLSKTGLMVALALTFQIVFSKLAQPAVGPLVNMVLYITTIYVGVPAAIFVGSLTPLVAFMVGIMPLFPVVFFIMTANSILVVAFSMTSNKYGQKIGIFVSAMAKFLFLFVSVRHLLNFFIPQVPPKMVEALSFPQFVTALTGGILALLIVNRLPKEFKK